MKNNPAEIFDHTKKKWTSEKHPRHGSTPLRPVEESRKLCAWHEKYRNVSGCECLWRKRFVTWVWQGIAEGVISEVVKVSFRARPHLWTTSKRSDSCSWTRWAGYANLPTVSKPYLVTKPRRWTLKSTLLSQKAMSFKKFEMNYLLAPAGDSDDIWSGIDASSFEGSRPSVTENFK